MQHYDYDDPYEREPLDSSHHGYDSPRRPNPSDHAYPQPISQYHDSSSRQDLAYTSYDRSQHQNNAYEATELHTQHSSRGGYAPPVPPHRTDQHTSRQSDRHEQATFRGAEHPAHSRVANQPTITPGADNFSEAASGGMAGIAYNVADRNARESGMEAARYTNQIPPPPSRAQVSNSQNNGYYNGYSYDAQAYGQSSHNLDPFASGLTPPAGYGRGTSSSPSRSAQSLPYNDPYIDDPYQGFSARKGGPRFGMVDPTEIEDDGDDGLHYPRNSQRNSMLSSSNSDRGPRSGVGAAAAVGGATGAGTAMGGYLGRSGFRAGGSDQGVEKQADWAAQQHKKSKRWKWAVILLIFLVVAGAIVGGVVGGLVNGSKNGGKNGHAGQSAEDDAALNGDLDVNSAEIKKLMNNPDLHRVFAGMDYTPLNTQYPDCLTYPPSQNNITRDVAVLSQLTNKIRLYGTDCNQTQMVVHAIKQLKMEDDLSVWLGVWQDKNTTTNARQLSQIWDIVDEYGEKPFEGIIVANEIIFREEMTVDALGTVLDTVRQKLKSKKIDLEVATSDLGDDWTAALAQDSDYLMANIHPFFAGVDVKDAAAWTVNFWEGTDKPFFKADTSKNIISETGWPSGGGTNCGSAKTCSGGSVAGIDEMNQYMSDWVCQALANGTNYFWFEAFDEPWKISFNEKGKEWEDKWGLMDVNRNLKDGVKIPDCGGKTVS